MSRRTLLGIELRAESMPSVAPSRRSEEPHAVNAPGSTRTGATVELLWLPLGAGGRSVRLNGRLYEAGAAVLGHRSACALYHSALVVTVPAGRFVIEQTPVPRADSDRGVVAGGAVGSRWAGHLRIFRYELRRWRDGVIADSAQAVESPRLLTRDAACAQRVLDLAPSVPTLVWGRDELGAGEMWNSNSLIAWLLDRGGIDAAAIQPPSGGRAPGWAAGVVVARRACRTALPPGTAVAP